MTKSFAALVAGVTVAVAACVPAPGGASAAVIYSTLSLPLAAGSTSVGGLVTGGVGSLSYTYDDTSLPGGSGQVDTTSGLTKLTLTFGTLTLDGTSTVDAPFTPVLSFLNGTLQTVLADFAQFSFIYSAPTYSLLDQNNAVVATGTPVAVTIVPGSLVPEPSALALLGLALATVSLVRRLA